MADRDEALLWTEESCRSAGDFRIFRIRESIRNATGNRRGTFFLVDAPDWVTIVPTLKDDQGRDCFLMVRQYRHGSGELTMEFPAGMIDSGEDPETAAARELLEETGYRADLIRIGDINPNPAFMTNTSYTYLAENLVLTAEQSLDEHEMVDLLLVPQGEVAEKMGYKPYHSAIMVQSFFWYLRSRGKKLL